MNNTTETSDTAEVDAFAYECLDGDLNGVMVVSVLVAQKLLRERDEARDTIRKMELAIQHFRNEALKPLKVKPKIGEKYHIPYTFNPGLPCNHFVWMDTPRDNARFAAGLCHSTAKAAIAHAKVLLSFTQEGGEA